MVFISLLFVIVLIVMNLAMRNTFNDLYCRDSREYVPYEICTIEEILQRCCWCLISTALTIMWIIAF